MEAKHGGRGGRLVRRRNETPAEHKRRTKAKDPFYRSSAWWKVRQKVMQRDRFTCTNCGADVRGKGEGRVDHILPRKDRPDLALDEGNLRTLCVACDNARHHWDRAAKKKAPVPVPLSGLPPGWE